MMDCRFSGRCNMRASLTLALLILCASVSDARSQEAQLPGDESLVFLPSAAEAAYQMAIENEAEDLLLDEAIFTEISPVTAVEVSLKLPPDQQE